MTPTTRTRLFGATALAASLTLAPAAFAQDHSMHDMPGMATPTPPAAAGYPDVEEVIVADSRIMLSPLGPYTANRDAGGTAWQPDATPHGGVHLMAGDWMVMVHGELNAVYSDQSGPRGDSRSFAAGMLMGMASRDLGPGKLQLKAMVSPDPFMGPEGYPLLLATGETADGVTHLVDRQHPHDLFMELSASYSLPVGDKGSLFVYGGLPGEPAFGPPAFMHRAAAMDSPEAPISHHWFDSTHVTFGVVTGGFTWDRWKVEASAFRGREPDQNRWDIETGDLDSRSARISFNPTENWSLQASWADITSPEALEPLVDEERVSLSALYGRAFGSAGFVSATGAWARKDKDGETLDAWLFESAIQFNDSWTLFARAEQVDQAELAPGNIYTVRKVSLGAIHDWRVGDDIKLGVGALINGFDIPSPLAASYGDAGGGMAFVRLKIG
ncbi:MAG TPA: hypothetical protein PLO65_03730 [Caulobacter sp.]|nr:hypothetical protein [Caulobacter sp.]